MASLPQNQVRPQAQPLSSFIQPTRRPVAAPAGPIEIPRVQQVGAIQQASAGSVAGVNRFAQVAQALAPFNQQLTQLVSGGMQLYAQGEVQKGINEATRAAALLDGQMRQSGAEYADETRKLAQTDPIAAMQMDTVNPYRRAGRQRALMEVATLQAGGAMVSAYRSNPDLVMQPTESGALAQLKATVTQGLVERYGISETSPGFSKFISQINQGSDRVTEMHWRDRQDYLKSTVPQTAAAEILGIYATANETGRLEIFRADGSVTVFTRPDPKAFPDPAELQRQNTQWYLARIAYMGATLDRMVEELGMPGDVTAAKRLVIERLSAVADAEDNDELRSMIGRIPVGPPDANGRRAAAAVMFAPEILDSRIKYGEVKYKQDQREKEQLTNQYQDVLADAIYGLPDGPEKLKRIEQLREQWLEQNPQLSRADLLESEASIAKTVESVQNRGRSVDGVSALLLEMDGRYGTEWNAAQADGEFEAALAQAPDDQRPALRQRYAELRRRKGQEAASPTAPQVNGLIDRKVKAQLRANYPEKMNEAAMRGRDPSEVMAGITDANALESARRQYAAYQRHVQARLSEAAGKKGAPLTTEESIRVASDALEEYGRNDADARRYLFPGIGGQAPAPGTAMPTPAGSGPSAPQLPPGTKPATLPTFPSGQLDNIPDRRSRVRSWREAPILDAASLINEGNRVAEGGKPSAALQRFARDAGTTPGALLNRQLDFYPGIKATPEFRQKLQRDGRQEQATRSTARATVATATGRATGYAMAATGWMLDLVTGARPATAAQRRPPMRSAVGMGGGGGQGGQIAMRSGGGGATPLTRLIGAHESFNGNYGAFNRGGSNNGHTAHGSGIDPGLTNMTIAEIQRRQLAPGVPKNQQLHAVGKYQIIGSTLRGLVNKGIVSPSERFTPAVQDKLFAALARGRIVRGNVEATMRGLQQEWIGLQYADKAKLRQATIDLMRNAGML
jgi:hypothetical protein